MAYYNPQRVDFNPTTMTIGAVGNIGRSLWDIYQDNRSNLASEAQAAANLAETARSHYASEKQRADELDQKKIFNNAQINHWGNQDKILGFNADTSRMNANIAAGRLNFDVGKYQKDLNDVAVLAMNRANLLNQNDSATAEQIGITPDQINSVRGQLKNQGYTDAQIQQGINEYVRQKTATLGSGYWNNPLNQGELFEARKAKADERENAIYAAKEMLVNSSKLQEKLSNKYKTDVKALINSTNPEDERTLRAILTSESSPTGGLNQRVILANSKQTQKIGENLATFYQIGNISRNISDGASNITGWFGAKAPVNSIAQFLNSDNMEATSIRTQIDALRAKMAKTARSNRVLDEMEQVMPKFGDSSTNKLLATLAASANLAYMDIQAQLKAMPNGIYSDEIQTELDDLQKTAKLIQFTTGFDPLTMKYIGVGQNSGQGDPDLDTVLAGKTQSQGQPQKPQSIKVLQYYTD